MSKQPEIGIVFLLLTVVLSGHRTVLHKLHVLKKYMLNEGIKALGQKPWCDRCDEMSYH